MMATNGKQPRNRKKQMWKDNRNKVFLHESEKLPLQQKISQFVNSNDSELILPNLTNDQRKFIHKYANSIGLKTKSHGAKNNRVMCITHAKRKIVNADARPLELKPTTKSILLEAADQMNLLKNEQVQENSAEAEEANKNINTVRGEMLYLNAGQRLVPPRSKYIPHNMFKEKQELPIFAYQHEILKMLNRHPVFIINGETGSGKTTQVPQYILNEACRQNRHCRVIVTQPRRVAAVSIAHRVAEERGEQIGDTVGYQIRMESRVSRTSNLVYTTSGFLLRSIMSDKNEIFRKITHLIIDEIHERDKYTDFTLIAIKEQLKHNRDLRIILMSATMDINLLSKYFDDCPVLNVPGQLYDVKIFHLEDILFHSGYRTTLMERYLRSLTEMERDQMNSPLGLTTQQMQQQQLMASLMNGCFNNANNDLIVKEPIRLDDEYTQELMDRVLEQCLERNRSMEELYEIFDQIQYYIESEDVPVDVGHSRYGLTPLMVACQCNCPKYVQLFIQRQANAAIKDVHGLSAYDYAIQHSDGNCKLIIESGGTAWQQETVFLDNDEKEKQRLLKAYQLQFNDDYEVDHDLILSLLEGLYRSSHNGAIMVFLPGYADIIQQRDLIQSTLPAGTFKICILHGQMDSKDQFEVLKFHPCRKIILSTNIGQTSITIPDLAFIIDSGKVKMKSYDSITESSQLRSVWISQADANQRSGRSGRTQNGICYRLYSLEKYNFMPKYCVPEFMRIALTEICLYAKTLNQTNDVQTFLSKSLNPPSKISVENAIKKLQTLEVFTDDEMVTDLGKILVQLPLDVQLGKSLLYSLFLRCFDPVLTIVAFLSIKDPFVIPSDKSSQGQASFLRKSFSGDTFSDPLGILELYKNYLNVRNRGRREREFCNKNFLSYSAMEMFLSSRKQISEIIGHRFPLSQCTAYNHDLNLVRYCLTAGLYPNLAVIDRKKRNVKCASRRELAIQRASALLPPGRKQLKEFINDIPHDWIIYHEKSRVAKICAINMNTLIPDEIVALQCGRDAYLEIEQNTDDSNESDNDDNTVNNDGDYDRTKGSGTPTSVSNSDTKTIMANDFEKVFASLNLNDNVTNNDYKNDNLAILCCDYWIKFALPSEDAKLLYLLRLKLRKLFKEFIVNGPTEESFAIAAVIHRVLNTLYEAKVNNTMLYNHYQNHNYNHSQYTYHNQNQQLPQQHQQQQHNHNYNHNHYHYTNYQNHQYQKQTTAAAPPSIQ